MEHLHEYWIHYTISNAIALTVLGLTWKIPTARRIALGVIFLLASIVNTYTVLTTPEAYLFYKDLAVLDIYRRFIDGWFATHIGTVVLPIAVGQSKELLANSGLPPDMLIEVGNDHRLADPEPLKAMLEACDETLVRAHGENR